MNWFQIVSVKIDFEFPKLLFTAILVMNEFLKLWERVLWWTGSELIFCQGVLIIDSFVKSHKYELPLNQFWIDI